MTTASGYKISIEVVKKTLDLGRQFGLPVDELLKQYGVRIEPIKGDTDYMPAEAVEFMLSMGLRLMPDPMPGLTMGLATKQHLFGLVAFLAQTSSTVGVCLEKLMQVEPLISDVGSTRLEQSPGEAKLVFECRFQDPFVRMHTASFVLCTYTEFMNTGTQAGQLVHEVHMAHPAPEEKEIQDLYRNAFHCPVIFNAREYRVVFPASAINLSVNTADPRLNTLLTEHAQKLLEERGKPSSFTDQVCQHIQTLLQDGNLSRENVAAMMNITSRTLHRKLRQEGTSYGDLLSQLRLERSCDLLLHSAQSVQAIARDAGFDEAHSFTRWFRQMTGLSPSEYRQKGLDPE